MKPSRRKFIAAAVSGTIASVVAPLALAEEKTMSQPVIVPKKDSGSENSVQIAHSRLKKDGKTMLIDIHAHAYRTPIRISEQAASDIPDVMDFCSAAQVVKRYDELGIDKGVLLPIVSPEIYLPQSNEDILEMAQQYPDRLIPYCNIDPRALTNSPDAPLEKLLYYYKEKGCKGVGEVMLNLPVMHPLVQNLFKCAQTVGLPVVFDGSDQLTGDFGLYDDPGLPQLEHTLQKFPDLILFGHGPIFWSEIARLRTPGERGFVFKRDGKQVGLLNNSPVEEEGVVPVLLRRYGNLYADLSDFTAFNAFNRDHSYGPKFLEEFKDRVFFGTDLCSQFQEFPLIDLLKNWHETGKISTDAFNKITHENAIRLLGL